MGLQKSFTFCGQTFSEAYWRILDYDFNPDGNWGKVVVGIYSSYTARDNGENWLDIKNFMVPEADNENDGDLLPTFATVMAVLYGTTEGLGDYIYSELKNTDTLSGAQDVLEPESSSSSS